LVADYALLQLAQVWLDFWSLPQRVNDTPRTEDEDVTFKLGLMNINMLYMSSTVLVFFDLQYVGRFWTSYEVWLSLRTLTNDGLMSTPTDQRRTYILCTGAASEAEATNTEAMIKMWSEKSPREAIEALGEDDIVVTNQSDKDQQLKILKNFAESAGGLYDQAVAESAMPLAFLAFEIEQ